MTESIENILKSGFGIWRKNHNIALPFLFNLFASFLLVIIFIASLFLILAIPLTLDVQRITNSSSNIAELMDVGSVLMVVLLFVIFVSLYILVNSFFLAGAVGMARRAIETKRTSLNDMVNSGKRKFLDLFLAQLIISVSIILLFLFLIGIPILIVTKVPVIAMIGSSLIEFGGNLLGLLVTVIAILFIAVPFAIVISDLGAIEGLKRGYRFFMDNKFPVMLLWIFVKYASEFMGYAIFFIAAIAFSLGILSVPIPSDISAISSFALEPLLMSLSLVFIIAVVIAILVSLVISVFVVSPLMTVWWSILYMDRVKSHQRKNDRIY